MDKQLIYTGPDWGHNWFYNHSYIGGGNARYYTFQIALNLLNQTKENPVIIETGCQRLENDIGDGRSTTIFCEYLTRYGGKLISIDINPINIQNCSNFVSRYSVDKQLVISDSVAFLEQYKGSVDLVYLDSWDYPLDQGPGFEQRRLDAQQHNLKELKAIEKQFHASTIILLDDNQLPGGGKPKLAKEYLAQNGYICLLDFHQSIWVKEVKR